MAAQPPEPPRTAEIDLHDIIPAAEVEPGSPAQGEFAPVATESKAFKSNDFLRIGWSGWTNVLFAALTVLGGVLCTVRFFDTPEMRRWTRAHESEYLYQRPADAAAAQEPIAGRTSARTYLSQAAAVSKTVSTGGGRSTGSNSPGPQLPPGSPQLPNAPANSAGSDSAARSRSSGATESRTGNVVATRSRQIRNSKSSRPTRGNVKSPNLNARASMHGPAKSDGRSLFTRNNVNRLTGARSSLAMNKACLSGPASHSMPNAMRSGVTILRGSNLNLAGLGREAAREIVRPERGSMNRR